MTAKVVYTGDLRCEAIHVKSGSQIETDAPIDNHGKAERFSPTDLVTVALSTCILTTLGIAGKAHDLNIEGAECEVEKIMASDPRRISGINVRISFPKSKPYSQKQMVMIERIANTCPVHLSLHPDLVQNISFIWPTE